MQLKQGAFHNYIKSSRALELLTVAELHLLAQLKNQNILLYPQLMQHRSLFRNFPSFIPLSFQQLCHFAWDIIGKAQNPIKTSRAMKQTLNFQHYGIQKTWITSIRDRIDNLYQVWWDIKTVDKTVS